MNENVAVYRALAIRRTTLVKLLEVMASNIVDTGTVKLELECLDSAIEQFKNEQDNDNKE
jgi:hypothetical protein